MQDFEVQLKQQQQQYFRELTTTKAKGRLTWERGDAPEQAKQPALVVKRLCFCKR